MTNQHPITPPPELRRQWLDNDHFSMVTGTHDLMSITRDRLNSVMDQSAQWGADQELEACCEYLKDNELCDPFFYKVFRSHRRPKPQSLKEQALSLIPEACGLPMMRTYSPDELFTLRRALEALPND
jgi:hypothetical protein